MSVASGRGARFAPADLLPARALSPLLILVIWEVMCRFGLVPTRILPAPSSVAQTFWAMVLSGELGANLLVSLGRVLAGLIAGFAVGAALALLAGLSRIGEVAIDPTIQIIRTLPFVALVPLFVVWFGIGETPKLILISIGALFPVYLNIFGGIKAVDAKLIECARCFGLSRLAVITNVILPGAMPFTLIALRMSLGVSWLSLVVAEQVNATAGLGYLINNARDFLRTDIIVVCLAVYAVLGLASDALVRALERRTLRWRPVPGAGS